MIRPATIDDAQIILQLIRDLAEYEKALDEVEATVDSIVETMFGENAKVFCDIVEHQGEVAGFAVWFLNYSTWQGRHGLYLEDLYVKPELRGHGYGAALLSHLAKKCVDNNWGRFQWWVLDWNTPSIEFYKSKGAVAMDEWTVFRVDGDNLTKLASQAK